MLLAVIAFWSEQRSVERSHEHISIVSVANRPYQSVFSFSLVVVCLCERNNFIPSLWSFFYKRLVVEQCISFSAERITVYSAAVTCTDLCNIFKVCKIFVCIINRKNVSTFYQCADMIMWSNKDVCAYSGRSVQLSPPSRLKWMPPSYFSIRVRSVTEDRYPSPSTSQTPRDTYPASVTVFFSR